MFNNPWLDYLNQPISSRLLWYGPAIGRGYSVLAYSESRVTYTKNGIQLEIWDSGIFNKILTGQLSFETPNRITVSTNAFTIPSDKFEEFEEQMGEIQTALREYGLGLIP
jgi:hypothetical protein